MAEYQRGRKLNEAPLIYTLAAFRINLLDLGKYVPAIQDRLRAAYPGFDTLTAQHFEFQPDPAGNMRGSLKTDQLWLLRGADLDRGIILGADRVVVHSTYYDRFEEFGGSVRQVLQVVKEVTELTHHQGVGFRQIDKILPHPERGMPTIEHIIRPEFLTHSLEGEFTGAVSSSRQEVFHTTAEGTLAVRVAYHRQEAVAPIPMDLMSTYNMLSGSPIMLAKPPVAILDFDHSRVEIGSAPFDVDTMIGRLDRMHQATSMAFRGILTKDAYEAL